MFSPAAKAGIGVGDSIITINDWNIEAMENIQVKTINYLTSGLLLQFPILGRGPLSPLANYSAKGPDIFNFLL